PTGDRVLREVDSMQTSRSRLVLPKLWRLTFICLSLPIAAWSQGGSAPAPAASGKEPLARVAGQTIYEDDLVPVIGGQMQQLRNQEYEVKSHALESVVLQKLLEAEAKKKGGLT